VKKSSFHQLQAATDVLSEIACGFNSIDRFIAAAQRPGSDWALFLIGSVPLLLPGCDKLIGSA